MKALAHRPHTSAVQTVTTHTPSRVSPSREARHLRRRGLYTGTDVADGQSVYLNPERLRTHMHLLVLQRGFTPAG